MLVSYEYELLPNIAMVNLVFHISIFKKCMGDPLVVMPIENICIKDSLYYKEIPFEILNG